MRSKGMRSISLVLMATLVALPAAAGPYRHGPARGHGRPSASRSWGYRPAPPPRYHHHHHHHHRDHDGLALALGLTAVGLGAFAFWTAAQQEAYANAHAYAFEAPLGQPVAWREGSAAGSVVTVSEGYADSGEYCREYQKEIVVGGRAERGWGIACLQEDGSWRVAR